jgi:uncharacterized BrkB/YihY/UPF0761 family membrane protein
MRGTLAQWAPVRVVRQVAVRSTEDDVSTHAAALAYQLFLSTLALSLVGLSVFGMIGSRLGVDVPEDATQQFENLKQGGLALGIASFVGLLWTASTLSRRARRALGIVFRTAPENVVRGTLRAIGTTLGLVLILGFLPVVTGILAGLTASGVLEVPVRLLGFTATVALELGLFFLSYAVLTPPGVAWRTHVPGAVVMTVAWEVSQLLGGLLLAYLVNNATLLYGTIGAIVGLLVMLRIASGLYLFGAELSAALAERRRASAPADPA